MTAASNKGAVRLDRVVIAYAREHVVHGVSLDIAPGEFVCLLGPSGCGKTTTLRAIAGLAGVDSGTITIDGVVANDKPAHERGIGMVFQDLALFPHMTVYRNIRFGLALRKVQAAAADQRIRDMVALLRLDGLESRLPCQLSGGQQQRVALARSLVVNPSVLLLDEPFAALDRKLREDMRREIRALQRAIGITTVFVTHDQEEALTMADRVVVMNKGAIEQVGTPGEVYETPANRFVLGFVGYSNFLRAENVRETDGVLRCSVAGAECTLGRHTIPGGGSGTAEIAVRPERARLVATGQVTSEHNRIPGTLRSVAYEGAMMSYDVVLANGQAMLVREQNTHRDGASPPAAGDAVAVEWRPADAVLLR